MELVYRTTGRVELAAATVTAKSGAILVGALIFPSLTNRFSIRQMIVIPQAICGLLMLSVVLFIPWLSSEHIPLLMGLLFLQSLLKQIFENARETFSKNLRSDGTHRTFQAELLHGFYKAQFVGPIISLLLIHYLPIQIPLSLDVFSFFVTAAMATRLVDDRTKIERRNFLAPLKYLSKTPGLLRIFLLRGVGYWIPVGIFNYTLFGIVKEHYGLELVNSAWIYAVIGFGSLLATRSLKNIETNEKTWIGRLPNGSLALVALAILGVTRVAFLKLPTFGLAMLAIGVGGVCNGINATATQAIRSRLTTKTQFPEVVSLEQIVARGVDVAVQTLCLLLISAGFLTYSTAIWVSAGGLILLGLLHVGLE